MEVLTEAIQILEAAIHAEPTPEIYDILARNYT